MVKFQKIVEGSAKWFEAKHKLCNEGIDIKKELDDFHALVVECEARRKGSMVSSIRVVVMQG
jgi:hypothetical protein